MRTDLIILGFLPYLYLFKYNMFLCFYVVFSLYNKNMNLYAFCPCFLYENNMIENRTKIYLKIPIKKDININAYLYI
jgi:hypothetical protein